MNDKKKPPDLFFKITQDFMWQNMEEFPGFFGVIDQSNLPEPFPPDKPDPPPKAVA